MAETTDKTTVKNSIIKIKVGTASCGIAAGADKTLIKLQNLANDNQKVKVEETGCIGMCFNEPLVEIEKDGIKYMYKKVTEQVAEKLYESHVINDNPVEESLVYKTTKELADITLLNSQKRIVLRNCGIIDPQSIEEYKNRDGYKALEKALSLSAEDVREIILKSGLRGRGGAGFPTGLKWKFAANAKGEQKYIICNADEGDPGAFMDRSVLEGDPHSVLEGLIIGGYAIGANQGYIYCRAEYPLAIKRLKLAIKQAKENNFLGKNIFGKDFSFDIHIKEGAGAFVCGEETALIASVEGKRGMPRKRPPFPANSGLWDSPTNINNVETLANIPWILLNSAEAFNSLGTEKSSGTKVFALAGKIKNAGLIEVEMGTPLRDIIFKIGGGIKQDKKFKAVQLGGPSGGCVPESLLDTPVDYDSITQTGAIMGSGGMVVLDEDTCIVDVAKFFLTFTQSESCGKCTFCRIGTKRMLEILTKISEGKGELEDLDKLEDLAHKVKETSLCGLGQTAPNPVLTTLRYFRDEYIEHITEKKCRAKVCKDLITFKVVPDKCIGCGACKRACPTNTISGKPKEVHFINQEGCIKCGACYASCKFDAIIKE